MKNYAIGGAAFAALLVLIYILLWSPGSSSPFLNKEDTKRAVSSSSSQIDISYMDGNENVRKEKHTKASSSQKHTTQIKRIISLDENKKLTMVCEPSKSSSQTLKGIIDSYPYEISLKGCKQGSIELIIEEKNRTVFKTKIANEILGTGLNTLNINTKPQISTHYQGILPIP